MKVCFFLLMLVVSGIYADTGDAIFSQPYSSDELANCVQSASLIDDFVPDFSGDCSTAIVWMVFAGTPPTELYIKIAENSGSLDPNLSVTIFAEEVPVVLTDTGDEWYGFTVYQVSLTLPTTIQLVSGKLYWFEVGTEPGSYWGYKEPATFGFGMWKYQAGHFVPLGDADGFFELKTPVALERNSWAAIKRNY